ncbi:unnamed protein product, partial [Prorocentrum cordatum]
PRPGPRVLCKSMPSRYFSADGASAQRDDATKRGRGGRGSGQGEHGKKRRDQATTELSTEASTAELEAIVFGTDPKASPPDAHGVGDDGAAEAREETNLNGDTQGADVELSGNGRPQKRRRGKAGAQARGQGAAAAWLDPDDAELTVDLKSRNRLHQLRRTAAETTISGQEYEQDDFEISL